MDQRPSIVTLGVSDLARARAAPDGHAWEVAWNPFFPLSDNDGRIVLPPPAGP